MDPCEFGALWHFHTGNKLFWNYLNFCNTGHLWLVHLWHVHVIYLPIWKPVQKAKRTADSKILVINEWKTSISKTIGCYSYHFCLYSSPKDDQSNSKQMVVQTNLRNIFSKANLLPICTILWCFWDIELWECCCISVYWVSVLVFL